MDIAPANVTIAAKLPAGIASEFALLADGRGMTRSALLRAIIEAVVEGRMTLPSDGEIDQLELARAHARMRQSFALQADFREHQRANPRRFGLREVMEEAEGAPRS